MSWPLETDDSFDDFRQVSDQGLGPALGAPPQDDTPLEEMVDRTKYKPPANHEEWVAKIMTAVPTASGDYVRMLASRSSQEFLEALFEKPLGKRAKAVRNLLLQKEVITSTDVKGIGYDPVAIFDLTDSGVPLKRLGRVQDRHGKQVSSYTLDPEAFTGRKPARDLVSRQDRDLLLELQGYKCNVCRGRLGDCDAIIVDHRVNYNVAGNTLTRLEGGAAYQILCASCNTDKGKVCGECPNAELKNLEVCKRCQWASPENFEHVATNLSRRVVFHARNEIELGNLKKLVARADELGLTHSDALRSA